MKAGRALSLRGNITHDIWIDSRTRKIVGLRSKENLEYMNIVLDKMSVVNVGAEWTIISLTASTSSSDHRAPVICSVFNDEKSEPGSVSGSISANPTLTRVRDSRLLNLEKRDNGKCITFSKWSAVKEGRLTRFPIMDEGVLGLFQWN